MPCKASKAKRRIYTFTKNPSSSVTCMNIKRRIAGRGMPSLQTVGRVTLAWWDLET